MSAPPVNPYPYGYETWSEKFSRKFKENPWVPAGCLATTIALTMSAVRMRQGKSTSMNYWMRARVGLQGLTLVALVAGSIAIKNQRAESAQLDNTVNDLLLTISSPSTSPSQRAELLSSATPKVLARLEERQKAELQEKVGFEERLKEAEVAMKEEEVMGKQQVVKGPSVVKHDKGVERATTGEVRPPTAGDVVGVEREGEVAKSGKSWWRVW